MLKIAVDAMGGERAPEAIVRGAALASLARGMSELEIILVGDTQRIGRILADERHDAEKLRIHHAAQAIRADERPEEALSAKPDASITVAARLVAAGEADAVVSAGPNGAAVLACARHFKPIAGVHHPALSAVYPTEMRRGEKDDPFTLVLDIGATLDATPDALVEFAVMGAAYAARVSKNARPRVALLGGPSLEVGKGPADLLEAHSLLLRQTPLNFVGHVDAVNVPRGHADVVVCAGFVGELVMRMLEQVPDTVLSLARYAYKDRLLYRAALGVLSSGMQRLMSLTDWPQYGGAPLLGYEQLYMDLHDRAGPRAVANAIKVCKKTLDAGVPAEIAARIGEFHARRHAARRA